MLDSSATLAFCFEDERTPAVIAIFDKVVEEGAAVPGLWRFEIANGLLVAQRRQRITPAFRREVFDRLDEARIEIDEECERLSWSATIHFADLCGLTVYDAAYLELAPRRACGEGRRRRGVGMNGRRVSVSCAARTRERCQISPHSPP